MKFPVFSLLAGNFEASETSSLETLSSSGESCANHGLRGDVRHWVCRAARALVRSYGIALSSHQHTASKFAVVNMSEGLAMQLTSQGLCP
jgi:hypothetical protein